MKKKTRFFLQKITVLKWQFRLFGFSVFFFGIVVGFYLTVSNFILPIFADTGASITKDTDTDFSQGTLSSVEVSGSGEGAVVQLDGDGGTGWLDTNWQFRRQVTIVNSGSIQTDYQIQMEVSYDSAMQPDFDDLRFSNLSGDELSYWLQTKTDSDLAIIWAEVDSLAGSDDTIIYMYYGNDSADSGSDGEETFLFFDDFDDEVIDGDKWTEVDPSGYVSETEGALRFDSSGGAWNHGFYSDQSFDRADLSFEFDYVWWQNNGSYDATMFGWKEDSTAISYTNFPYAYYNNGSGSGTSIDQQVYEDGGRRSFSGHTWNLNQDYDVRVRMKSSGGAFYDYSINSGNDWTNAYNSSYSSESDLHIGWTHHSGHHDFDNVRVRKWMDSEPTSSFGSEESALSPSGSYESPIDSNVIDLTWNGNWGDGTDGSTAFSATVAEVGANSSVTFQMRTAATAEGLTSANYENLGTINSGITFTKTKAELDALSELETGVNGRYIQVKATLASSDGVTNPQLDGFTVLYMSDDTAPETNASSIVMKKQAGGATLNSNDWSNNLAPYFSWTAGDDSQSQLKGYCLYLGTDPTGNPATTKGLLGTSPISTAGTSCQFIVDATNIDFATTSLRGSLWLTSDSNSYYLNIKAIDLIGNVYASDSTQFQFRLDNTIPSNPAYVSLPGDWISTKAVTAYWASSGGDAPSDSHSGLAGMQYKIGATGIWYGVNHSGAEDLTDLLSHNSGSYSTVTDPDYVNLEEGTNTMYFRTWDNAGNVSVDYATGTIKLNTVAPSVPRNLEVTPDDSTTNEYSFNWDAPTVYAGVVDNITYCYTVNTLPSTLTCNFTGAGETSLDEDAYATQPGTNTFYVIAKDEAGNANYEIYASAEFEYSGTAPGIVQSADIADVSVKATKSWKLAVSWEEPEAAGAGVANYKIYHSENGSSYELESTVTGISYVDTSLNQDTHYYKIKACDSANNCGAFSSVVSLYPDGKFTESPELTGGPNTSNITTKRATLSWSTNRTSDSKISYGKKSGDYYDEEPSNSIQTTDHEIKLTSLDPGTKYYYKAKWTDEDGNTGESEEEVFETDEAPTVKEVNTKTIGIDNATIEFTTENANSVKIYYGESTSFGGIVELSTSISESTHIAVLSGLKDGTKYYYKINTFDLEEDEYEGTILDFTTLPRPKISDVRIQQVKGSAQPTVLITWKTNTEISSIITYYPVSNPSQSKDDVEIKLISGEHKMFIKNLLPQTDYYLTVKGVDKAGNQAISDLNKVTTATDTRPPQISELNVEGSNIPLSQENKQESASQLIVSWNTDEPAFSQVEYGEGSGSTYAQKTQKNNNATNNHLVVISGLSSSKVYHIRAISTDEAGNESKSVDVVTITPKVSDNALDLVVNNLRNIFGFVE